MVKHKAWATTIVAPKSEGSMTTKGQMKPTCRVSWTASQAGENSKSKNPFQYRFALLIRWMLPWHSFRSMAWRTAYKTLSYGKTLSTGLTTSTQITRATFRPLGMIFFVTHLGLAWKRVRRLPMHPVWRYFSLEWTSLMLPWASWWWPTTLSLWTIHKPHSYTATRWPPSMVPSQGPRQCSVNGAKKLCIEHADEPSFMTRWFRDMHSKVPVGQIWFLAHISNSVEHSDSTLSSRTMGIIIFWPRPPLTPTQSPHVKDWGMMTAAPGLPPGSRLRSMWSGPVAVPQGPQSEGISPGREMPLTVPCIS